MGVVQISGGVRWVKRRPACTRPAAAFSISSGGSLSSDSVRRCSRFPRSVCAYERWPAKFSKAHAAGAAATGGRMAGSRGRARARAGAKDRAVRGCARGCVGPCRPAASSSCCGHTRTRLHLHHSGKCLEAIILRAPATTATRRRILRARIAHPAPPRARRPELAST